MSEIKAQLQQFDLPAELKQANVGRDTESSKPPIIDDQEYECRLRVAEGLVQVLRKAGYSCYLGDAPMPRRDQLT